MNLNIQPAAGFYTITPIDSNKSSDTIVYAFDPDKTQGDPFVKGKIVAVGTELITEEGGVIAPEFNIGDIVWYSYSGFEEITENGKKIRLIRFKAVVGKE